MCDHHYWYTIIHNSIIKNNSCIWFIYCCPYIKHCQHSIRTVQCTIQVWESSGIIWILTMNEKNAVSVMSTTNPPMISIASRSLHSSVLVATQTLLFPYCWYLQDKVGAILLSSTTILNEVLLVCVFYIMVSLNTLFLGHITMLLCDAISVHTVLSKHH